MRQVQYTCTQIIASTAALRSYNREVRESWKALPSKSQPTTPAHELTNWALESSSSHRAGVNDPARTESASDPYAILYPNVTLLPAVLRVQIWLTLSLWTPSLLHHPNKNTVIHEPARFGHRCQREMNVLPSTSFCLPVQRLPRKRSWTRLKKPETTGMNVCRKRRSWDLAILEMDSFTT